MKIKTKQFVSTILLLTLVVGCFAGLPQITRAADDTYKIQGWESQSMNTIYYKNGSTVQAASTLMKLTGGSSSEIIYALCVNQTYFTYLDTEYKLVELNDYPDLTSTQKDQLLALLNYVSINYGLNTPEGAALAQIVIWRIIHPDIEYIQPTVKLTLEQINDVFDHYNTLNTTDIVVNMQGTANKADEDTNYAYYGPFSVSENFALSQIDFTLSFPQGTTAAFTNTAHNVITQVKQGEEFYVRVPLGTTQETFTFTATASKSLTSIVGIKFLVSTGANYQPLMVYQPLVQPLVSPDDEPQTYSCTKSFTLASPLINVTIAKTVNGIDLKTWFSNYTPAQQAEILAGMSFKLYRANEDCTGPIGELLAQCSLNAATGRIDFGELDLKAGWYVIVEVLTGKAAVVFEQPEPLYIYIGQSNILSSLSQTNVDGIFTINYMSGYALNIKLLGENNEYNDSSKHDESGQNLSTERFDTVLPDGTIAPSFCADLGAHNVYGSYVFDITNHGFSNDDMLYLVAALDYINTNIGSIQTDIHAKAVAQIIVWNLILKVDGSSGYADNWFDWDIQKIEGIDTWYAPYSELVDDILANSAKYISLYNAKLASTQVDEYVSGAIFIKGNDKNYAAIDQQRQIVVLYGSKDPVFDNKAAPETNERVLGPAYESVTATNAGNRNTILAGLNPKNGNPYYNDKTNPDTPYVVPNSNHFVYATLNRADLESPEGVKLDMLVGNKFTIVGAATVKLVKGNLELSIDGVGSFGVTAFNKLPVFNNGNIHSQKVADLAKFGATTGFNHDNTVVLPCPAGDVIYLYIHCSSIRFYQ
ncbi:MAG: hypothetical protein LBQ98_10225 [Nitrososphaerota archaeon]|jgi:hypothetical protein|nr:hypothetical protein [Nitrososphaerota archaeon]